VFVHVRFQLYTNDSFVLQHPLVTGGQKVDQAGAEEDKKGVEETQKGSQQAQETASRPPLYIL